MLTLVVDLLDIGISMKAFEQALHRTE